MEMNRICLSIPLNVFISKMHLKCSLIDIKTLFYKVLACLHKGHGLTEEEKVKLNDMIIAAKLDHFLFRF